MNNIKLNIYGYRFTFDIPFSNIKNYHLFVLRGLFGMSLKKFFCIKNNSICNNCLLLDSCVYRVVFEPKIKDKDKERFKLEDIPRAFIIHQVSNNLGKLIVEMIIIGEKIRSFLPYIIFAFDRLGGLKTVETMNGFEIYSSKNKVLKNIPQQILLDKNPITNETLTIEFLTPARIKYKSHYIENIEFSILIQSLLRRIRLLQYFYDSDNFTELDTKNLLDKSKNIIILKKEIEWVDWGRFSKRQGFYMKLGGILGVIKYKGNFSDFSEILRIGEYIHIGKNCSFGLGRYKIKEE